ncbi:MAG: hypothetical protein QNL62_24665, partial [Gammaproteobacteria bacterium]|nr:hypothetical protein [Gammaproteobacteria bacterium]
PVSANEWILLGSNARHPGRVLDLAVQRINGLHNHNLNGGPPSPVFTHFVQLYDRLRLAGVLDIAQAPGTGSEVNYFWYIHDYKDAHGDSVRELLKLIGIKAKLNGSAIILPLHETVGSSTSAVHIKARSAWEVLRIFGDGIAIPPAHLEAGIVEPLKSAVTEEKRFIMIRSSEKRPDDATVRIRFRDRWFYIDATDTRSKRAFGLLRTFIGMRLADPATAHKAPVLTVPVK